MPKLKSKNFIISLGIYPFDIIVSLGESDEELGKRLRRFGIDTEKESWQYEQNGLGVAVRFPSGQLLIRGHVIPRTPKEKGGLAHEIFHATHFLMDTIKTPLTLDTCEAYAYVIDYITEKIYEKL